MCPTRRTLTICFFILQISGLLGVSLNKNIDDAADVESLFKDGSTSRSLAENCDSFFNPTCLKLKFLSTLEKYSKIDDFQLYPGVKVVKDQAEDKTETSAALKEIAREFPDDVNKRIDSYLWLKLTSFLDTHSLNVKMNGNEIARNFIQTEVEEEEEFEDDDKDNTVEEGRKRRRKKSRKIYGILAAVLLVKKIVKTLAIGALFVVAGKALVTSLAALIISSIIGFKSLLAKKEIPIIGHHEPIFDHAHDWAYGRSLNLDLPEHMKKEE